MKETKSWLLVWTCAPLPDVLGPLTPVTKSLDILSNKTMRSTGVVTVPEPTGWATVEADDKLCMEIPFRKSSNELH